MPEVSECSTCQYYAHDLHLVCAVHPDGVTGETCSDFRPLPADFSQRFVDFLSLQQQTEESLELLVSHPMPTGICSRCGAEIERDESGVVHWNCPCGWLNNLS